MADATKIAAGILFVASDGDVLLLRRSSKEENFAGHWALPGGKGDDGETPEQAARREVAEEIVTAPLGPIVLIDQRDTPNGMRFHTFRQDVEKFVPKLNDEHSGYAWASLDMPPEPMHPAVKELLAKLVLDGVEKKMAVVVGTLVGDPPVDMVAMDRAIEGLVPTSRETLDARHDLRPVGMAFDRASVRTTTRNGHMVVETTPITKACVNPYRGKEIPDYQALGLDPEKIYQLYRDPEELARAADTFNGLPLVSVHTAMMAQDHEHDVVIGSTGTDAVFKNPYLMNSLVVWTKEGIDAIESGEQKELSGSYHYRADMTPGVANGVRYDGVMRDIHGNHVAVVKKGRAGADVLVADSALEPLTLTETFNMSKKIQMSLLAGAACGAIMATIKPKLAMDAKIDLQPLLKGVTAKNFKDRKAGIVSGVRTGITGKLAADSDADVGVIVEAVATILDEVGDTPMAETIDPVDDGLSRDAGSLSEEAKTFLAGKLSDEDMATLMSMMDAPAVADDEFPKKDGDDDKKNKNMAKDKDVVTKTAMDAALGAGIDAAVKRERDAAKALREAERAVRPYVGELVVAMDSAEEVYVHALTAMGVADAKSIHPSAYPALLKSIPVPGTKKPVLAQDAAVSTDFNTRFADAGKIKAA